MYNGRMRNGLPHGQGTMTFPNGTTFAGEFEDGKLIVQKD
jgi:hypothetical protein